MSHTRNITPNSAMSNIIQNMVPISEGLPVFFKDQPTTPSTTATRRVQTHLVAPTPDAPKTKSIPTNLTDYELLGVLGLADRQQLRDWLSTDWIAARLREYKTGVFDRFPAPREHTWLKHLQFQINMALNTEKHKNSPHYGRYEMSENAETRKNARQRQQALRSRYLGSPTTTDWSIKDHDLRFVIQMVHDGQAAGNMWAGLDTQEAITRAWAVLRWFRVQYGTYDSVPKSVNLHGFGYSHLWREFLDGLMTQA
jgi:hypothetical protein